MKKKIILLTGCGVLTLVSIGATPIAREGRIIAADLTPLYLSGKESYFQYSTSVIEGKPLIVKCFIVNDLYPDGKQLFSKTHTQSETITYKYSNAYTRTANQIKFVWMYEDNTNEHSISYDIPLGVSKSQKIASSFLHYESTNSYYSYKANRWTEKKQELNFYNFDTIYMPDYYHKLDLSTFFIEKVTSFPSQFTCTSAELIITNRNGVFNGLPHNSSYATIPLSLKPNNGYYVLSLKNRLFVNQYNLLMSSTQKNGYVATKYVYFPINWKRYEEEFKCTISIKGLGIDDATFITSFKYKSLLNIFGDCRNSEYCIVSI